MIHVPYIFGGTWTARHSSRISFAPDRFQQPHHRTDRVLVYLQCLSLKSVRPPAISHNSYLTSIRIARLRKTTRFSMWNKRSQSFSMR